MTSGFTRARSVLHILAFRFAVSCAKLTVMDPEMLARDLIRAIRGRRSQAAFSRRLQSKSNVVATWETGRRWPTAAKFFWAVSRAGGNWTPVLERFAPLSLDRTGSIDLSSPAGVAGFLSGLRGNTAIQDIAARAHSSRFAVARWLKGQTEPRLPEFLQLIEAMTFRTLDFVSCLVDPNDLQSVREEWKRLQAARGAAYELPWSHAVLRVLELAEYRSLSKHVPGFIAARLGISTTDEERCLAILEQAEQISFVDGRWLARPATIDTRQSPEMSRKLKTWWAQVALERLDQGGDGLFSYNLFTVSRADFERLQELHRAYFRELRSIVAQSEPGECVGLVNMQLMSFEKAGSQR